MLKQLTMKKPTYGILGILALIMIYLGIEVLGTLGHISAPRSIAGNWLNKNNAKTKHQQQLLSLRNSILIETIVEDSQQYPRLLHTVGPCTFWQVAPGVEKNTNREQYVIQKCNRVCVDRKTLIATPDLSKKDAERLKHRPDGQWTSTDSNSLVHQFSGSFVWNTKSLSSYLQSTKMPISFKDPYTASRVRNVSGTTWFLDVSHGKARLWDNLCHWSDHVFSMMDTMLTAPELFAAEKMAFNNVFMWQIFEAELLGAEAAPWFRDTLKPVIEHNAKMFLGSNDSSVVELQFRDTFEEETVCFDQVVLPRYVMGGHFSNLVSAEGFKQQFADYFGYKLTARYRKVVFINRKMTRVVTNMDQLKKNAEKMFQKIGIEVEMEMVYLEGMSPQQQMETFANSGIVIAAHGAALSNMAVMQKGAVLLEIMPCGLWSGTYRKLAQESGLLHYEVRMESIDGCNDYLGRTYIHDNFAVPLVDFQTNFTKAAEHFTKWIEQ